MQKTLLRLSVILLTSVFSTAAFSQQTDTLPPTSIDPKLIEYRNARIPKEYVIAGIQVSGIKHLDTSIVSSISGLLPGDKYMHPGEDIFAKAITALWKQKLFSNVQVFVTKIEDNKVWVELNVQERARLGNFKFFGINKSEEEDIMAKVNLAKQTIVTENTIRETKERINKFFSDKGYLNVSVDIQQKPDTTFSNSIAMDIYIKKGQKVHIDGIHFYGNDNVDGWRLKKQMKGTKEMSRITLHPDQRLKPSPFGSEKNIFFERVCKGLGLSLHQ
jgi:outer membrane protein insertion porin family